MAALTFLRQTGIAVAILVSSLQLRGADDIIVNDFTTPDYGSWKTTGDAFGKGPLTGDALDKLGITNYRNFAVATSKPDDASRHPGTLTSPEFTIERPYISFLIAGASSQHALCMNLLLDGIIIKSATGAFSNHLDSTSWDVSSFMGKKVQVQVVHNAADGGGYISVAHIVQTDHPESVPMLKAPLYQEALRPQFHFTARQWTVDKPNPQQREEGWMNDPNGLIYYDHEYHLFSQRWAECWIHAVSPDMVHWTELQPAFWETTHGSGCQSGTCVIDYGNTSGLSPDKSNPAMVAFWPTWDNKTQNICYSLDHGRTWKAYEKNPVLVHSERDPKVFWYEPTKSWVMFLYDQDRYRIFTSKNLLSWDDQHSEIPNSHECPDFFQLPVDGDKSKMKWVLVRGNGLYSIGEFDGTKFTEETAPMPSDSGRIFTRRKLGQTPTPAMAGASRSRGCRAVFTRTCRSTSR